jgi:hypothetical protein
VAVFYIDGGNRSTRSKPVGSGGLKKKKDRQYNGLKKKKDRQYNGLKKTKTDNTMA